MPRAVDRVYTRLHRLWMPPGRRQTAFDRWGVRFWTRVDTALYRRLGWSAVARLMRVDVLLLRTTGRRTGLSRQAMVACLDRGDHFIVGGGNWGWDRDPGWVHNLAAHPVAEVVRRRHTFGVRGVVLTGADANEAADALATAYPHSQAYVQRRTRPVPTVRLDRLDG